MVVVVVVVAVVFVFAMVAVIADGRAITRNAEIRKNSVI